MSEQSDDAGLAGFQDEVLKEIRMLNNMVELNAGANHPLFKDSVSKERSANRFMASFGYNISMRLAQMTIESIKKRKNVDERTGEVRAFLKEDGTRRMLCAGLRTVERNLSKLAVRDMLHDASEIASAITPLLFARARAKAISLPYDPFAFALSAWTIARTGIGAYCAGLNEEADPLSL